MGYKGTTARSHDFNSVKCRQSRVAYRLLFYDTDTTERYRYSTDTYRDTFMLHKGKIESSRNYSHEALYDVVNMSNEYSIKLWDLDLLVLNKQ